MITLIEKLLGYGVVGIIIAVLLYLLRNGGEVHLKFNAPKNKMTPRYPELTNEDDS